jgi:hypothetical protein
MKKWILGIVLAAALPAAAQAQGPYGYWGYGFVEGYGQGQVTADDNVPYFSAHPPVYYSLEIMRRPMGPSPFAYPGFYNPMMMAAPANVAPAMAAAPMKMEPVMIENSFFASKRQAEQKLIRNATYVKPLDREAAAAGTQTIVNPFVKR